MFPAIYAVYKNEGTEQSIVATYTDRERATEIAHTFTVLSEGVPHTVETYTLQGTSFAFTWVAPDDV